MKTISCILLSLAFWCCLLNCDNETNYLKKTPEKNKTSQITVLNTKDYTEDRLNTLKTKEKIVISIIK